MMRFWVPAVLVTAFVAAGFGSLEAKEKYRSRAINAANVLDEVMGARDSAVPEWILKEAVGVIVFPSVKKGGFGLGARWGGGLGTFRREGGAWGPPVFFNVRGGSFGLQIGGQVVDVVLVIINEDGVRSFLGDKFTLGGAAGVSAGPVGRNAEADTNLRMRAKILVYARSRGLFAGLTLEGSVVKPDHNANGWAYGRKRGVKDIAYATSPEPPEALREFQATVRKYAGGP